MKRYALGAGGAPAEPCAFVTVDGARLAYQIWGEGVPVVCLHAIGHGAQDFAPLAAQLGDGFQIIALDWPGQGRSDPDKVTVSAERYLTLLEGAVAQLGLDRFILIGNSIGGAAALLYAHKHRERVRGLVLANPGGLAPINWLARFVVGRMVAFFAAGERKAWWYGPAFRLYYRRILPRRAARAQRRRIIAARSEIAPVLRQAWESFAALEADIRALGPDLRMPVLFAWAKRDQVVALSRSKKAIETFSDHRLELFDAGHSAFLEEPEKFADVFRDFVARLPAP